MHGGADGWDSVFDRVAREWEGITVMPRAWDDPTYNPGCYTDPLSRNQHMVDLCAHWRDVWGMVPVCWAFAGSWASGTGHCARRARQAGIKTIDYGVSTDGLRPAFERRLG